jgi:hypothetical protein
VRAIGVSTAGALATLAVGCSAASVQAATGLEEGVHPDPGSPAAKEYTLPLNQARRTGADPAGHEGSAGSAPFGAGIHPPRSGGSSPPESPATGSPGQRGASNASSTRASGTGVTIPPTVLNSVRSQDSPEGDGSLLALVGGGVATLLLGGFGGALMRRSHRSAPSA